MKVSPQRRNYSEIENSYQVLFVPLSAMTIICLPSLLFSFFFLPEKTKLNCFATISLCYSAYTTEPV